MAESSLSIAQATRPFPGEALSGDLAVVDWSGSYCRLSVIDGLGHGPEAAAAASAGRTALVERPALAPCEAVRACHGALVGTRGAAMLVVQLNPADRRLTYAGAGNVEARLWQPTGVQYLVPARGIVGSVLPTCRSVEVSLDPDWLLLVYTDGVSARFDLGKILTATGRDVQRLADDVLTRYGRPTDDATVVVVAPAR